MSKSPSKPTPEISRAVRITLQCAAFSLFAARGALYLTNKGPLSTFFWNENWLSGIIVRLFEVEWEHYTATSEFLILYVQKLIGAFYLICAAMCLWPKPRSPLPSAFLISGSLLLIPYWILRWESSSNQFPMLLEHFLQWSPPLLLAAYGRMSSRVWIRLAIAATVFTFVGHGFYALGWRWPRPHSFINMTMKLTPLSEQGSVIFLIFHGVMDMVAAALLLWPRTRVVAALYMTVWGLATAFARVFSHITPAEDFYGLHPWLAETVVRFPHGLIPLAIALVCLHQKKQALSSGAEMTPDQVSV